MPNEILKPMPELKQVMDPPKKPEELHGTRLSRLHALSQKYDVVIQKVNSRDSFLSADIPKGYVPERTAKKEIDEAFAQIKVPENLTRKDLIVATKKAGQQRKQAKAQILIDKTRETKRRLREDALPGLVAKKATVDYIIELLEDVDQIQDENYCINTREEIKNSKEAAEKEIIILTTPVLTKKVLPADDSIRPAGLPVSSEEGKGKKPKARGKSARQSSATITQEAKAKAIYEVKFPEGKVVEASKMIADYSNAVLETARSGGRIKLSELKKRVHGAKEYSDAVARSNVSGAKAFLKDNGWNLRGYYTAYELKVDKTKEQEYYAEKIGEEVKPAGGEAGKPNIQTAPKSEGISAAVPAATGQKLDAPVNASPAIPKAGPSVPETRQIPTRLTTDSYRAAAAENIGWLELSKTESHVVYPLFEVNTQGTDYRFKFAAEIGEYLNAKGIGITEATLRSTLRNLADKFTKMQGIPSSLVPPETKKFLEHVRSGYFRNCNFEQLSMVTRRTMPFSEVLASLKSNVDVSKQPIQQETHGGTLFDRRLATTARLSEDLKDSSVIFTKGEIYSLVSILLNIGGTELGSGDEGVLRKIEEALRGEHEHETIRKEDTIRLLGKVRKFTESPEEILTANGEDEQTASVLLTLHTLGTEKLKKLGLIPEE